MVRPICESFPVQQVVSAPGQPKGYRAFWVLMWSVSFLLAFIYQIEVTSWECSLETHQCRMCTGGGGWKGPKPDLPTFQPSNWHFPLHFKSRRSWKVKFRLSRDRPSNLPTHFSTGGRPLAVGRLEGLPGEGPKGTFQLPTSQNERKKCQLEGWKVGRSGF